MPRTVISLFAVYILLAIGLRGAVHRCRTGSFGLRLPRGQRVAPAWIVGTLLAASFTLIGLGAPLLQLTHVVQPVPWLLATGMRLFGGAAFAVGLATMLVSQHWVGASWRVGVDAAERTALVTSGPFALVRNPIYTGIVVAAAGLVALAPTLVAIVGLGLLVGAVEAQVRWIEEPHLRAAHAAAYAAYAAQTGRFVPAIGRRLPPTTEPPSADHTLTAADPHESARLHALDALRATAMLLGIALHAAVPYMDAPMVGLPWAIRDGASSPLLSTVFWWIHGFRMPLFFLLAGFFAAQLEATRGCAAYLRHRVKRILVPFLAGSLVLLPVTFCVFAAGWWIDGACTWDEIRRMKFQPAIQTELLGPAHLWFLEYLFLYCLLFWAVRVVRPTAGHAALAEAGSGWRGRLLTSRWRPLWCAVPTALLLGADLGIFTTHHNSFVPSPGGLAHYAIFFAAGLYLYRFRADLDRFVPDSVPYLIVSVPLFVYAQSLLRAAHVSPLGSIDRVLLPVALALFAWLSIFGLLGLCLRALARPRASLRYLSDAAYWTYLIHLPIVAALQIVLVPLPAPPVIKYVIVATLTAALCLWSYERWVRYSFVGTLVNGRRLVTAGSARGEWRWPPIRAWPPPRRGGARRAAAGR